MLLPLGIEISANGAAAIGTLNRIAERIQNIGGAPANLATLGMRRFGMETNSTLERIQGGFQQVEGSWMKLGGMLGLPLQLTGLVGAITGIHSLKDALIGANSELETSKVRMSAMLKDFNDSDKTATGKGVGVMRSLEKYAMQTPFKIQNLTEAATTLSSLTKSPDALMQMTKLSAKLAALKGTTDVNWAAQSLSGALNGNTTSLKESFGINVSEDSLTTMAMMTKYGNTRQGRYAALQRMIDQKAGKGDGIVKKLSETGMGAVSTLQDEMTMPFTLSATKGYDIGVKALVHFNDAFMKFSQSQAFTHLSGMLSDRFVAVGNQFANVLGLISNNLGKIPDLITKYTPLAKEIFKIGAVIGGVNIAAMGLKATLGAAGMVFTTTMRLLAPLVTLIANPLLLAGLLALSAAMWPTAKSLDVGGKSLDTWLTSVEKWSGSKDWAGMFAKPLNAIKKLLNGDYLKGGTFNFTALMTDAFGGDSLLGRIGQNVMMPMLKGMKTAIENAFPQLIPMFKQFTDGFKKAWDVVTPYLPIIEKVALGLAAVTVVGKALGVASPVMALAGAGFRALAGGIGFLEAVIANPLILAGITVLTAALYPLVSNLQVGGKSIDGWLSKFGKDSASVDWTGIFNKPMAALKSGLEGMEGAASGSWDVSAWWKSLIAPDSLIGRLGAILTPITHGIGDAIKNNFPEVGKFLGGFSNIGATLGNVWKIVGDVFFPFLQGLKTTALPALKTIGGALLALTSFAWTGISGVIKWIAWLVGTDQAKSFFTLLGQAVGRPLAIIAQVIEYLPKAAHGVETWWKMFENKVNSLDAAFQVFLKGVQDRWEKFKENWRTGVQIIAAVFMAAWTPVGQFFSSMWDGFKNVQGWVKDIASGIGQWFSGIMDNLPAPLRKLLDYLIGAVGTAAGPTAPTAPTPIVTVAPTSPLYVSPGVPVTSSTNIPLDPHLPMPGSRKPGFIGPVMPFKTSLLDNTANPMDFGGGGEANSSSSSVDLSGMSVPVTIYSTGTNLDSAALIKMLMDQLGPQVASLVTGALNGTKVS
jgi:hypothetical protein